jgi:hypothetical protein
MPTSSKEASSFGNNTSGSCGTAFRFASLAPSPLTLALTRRSILSKNEGFKDSESLTKWVIYMLYAQILIAVIAIISGYLEYKLLSDFQNGVYTSQELAAAGAEASDQRQGIVGVLYLVVSVISGFFILRWIHSMNYNARQLGAVNMKFTPGWSIGYYFIPILTLWKPYQAMKEIWKASKNPLDWASQDTSSILPIWWGLWLISIILGQAVFRLSNRAEELSGLINLNLITQVSNFLDIPLALVLLVIVNNVYKMQSSQLDSANKQIQPTAVSVG